MFLFAIVSNVLLYYSSILYFFCYIILSLFICPFSHVSLLSSFCLGTFCGYTANATDYPFIYFVAPTMSTLFRTVCVKSCPTSTSTTLDCLTNSMVHNCSGISISQATGNSSSSNTSNSTSSNGSSSSNGTNASSLISKKPLIKDIMLNYKGKKKAVTLKHLTSSYNYSEIVVIYPSVACKISFLIFFVVVWTQFFLCSQHCLSSPIAKLSGCSS